jgi:hypothetical protein
VLGMDKIRAMVAAMARQGSEVLAAAGGPEKAIELMVRGEQMRHAQESAWIGRLRPYRGTNHRTASRYEPHQGKREMARRVKQGAWLNA